MKKTIRFFDKVEDKIRSFLSHYPIIYALIGGFAVVQFWRGVWHLSDDWGWASGTSLIVGVVVMLITGLLVSFFIGDNIVITGLRKEKKLAEKTEEEIRIEEDQIEEIERHIIQIEKNIDEIKDHISNVKEESK
jgi:low affinity Fe/Cu permease